MTGTHTVIWRIEPVAPPRPRRHCSTCCGSRLFHSSGKIRLNANGRRLDAWLIYKCESCGKTWNLPLVERVAITSITRGDLLAMHRSDPGWVREREFDLATLRRHCDQIHTSSGLSITKTVAGSLPRAWSKVALVIEAPRPTGQRLDRLLATQFKLARSELKAMQQAGGLQLECASGKALRKPVNGRITLRITSAHLTAGQRAALTENLSES